MNNAPPYTLLLQGQEDAAPHQETVNADSDEEAMELGRLRLLLTNDYVSVAIWSGSRRIATLRRDGSELPPAS